MNKYVYYKSSNSKYYMIEIICVRKKYFWKYHGESYVYRLNNAQNIHMAAINLSKEYGLTLIGKVDEN